MAYPKFDEKELKVVGEVPNFMGPPTPLYDFPVSRKEAYIATMKRKPIWQITDIESRMVCPKANPDNIARAFVFEDTPIPPEKAAARYVWHRMGLCPRCRRLNG